MASFSTWAGGAVVAVAMLGCGARTDLLLPGGSSETTDAGAGSDGAPDASTDAISPPDAAPDAAVQPRCYLHPAGRPIVLGAFSDQHAEAPSLAVVDRGSDASPAQVVLQTYRSGGSGMEHAIFASSYDMGSAWPDDIVETHPLSKVGTDSHGWAVMTRVRGAQRRVAISWYGDPDMVGRTMFRLVDVDPWKPHDNVDLAFDGGGSALSIAAGAATSEFGAGYAGDGFGLVWRMDDWESPDALSHPVAAVLDDAGNLLIGPHPLAGWEGYPGRAPSITWSGSTYLMATSFDQCPPGEGPCDLRSVVLTRMRPASGDAVDDSGIDHVISIPALESGWMPRRASIASDGVDTYVAWSEGPADAEDDIRTLRLARLTDAGKLVGSRVVAENVPLLQSVRIEVAPFGVAVIWAEDGDASLSYNDAGRSRLAVSLSDRELEPLGAITRIDTTQFGSYGWATGASIDTPQSLLLAWPGYPEEGGLEVSWVARLDCFEEPITDAGTDAATAP